jgi:hypothetical protein
VIEINQERDVQDIRGRRGKAVAAAALAAMLLVGAAGCGGGSSDSSSGSDGATKTTKATGTDSGTDSGGEAEGSGDLPNPCDLVPLDKASEILGGEAATPEAQSSDVGVGSKSCSWQLQASLDNPTLDGAGHILTLNVTSPPETMSMDDFWKASKGQADEELDIDGCDEGFSFSGMVNGLKDGVYLTATAGLADTSPAAQESATDLVSTACSNL